MTERLPFHFSLSRIGEGNGNPLQCSCLENPRDGGAWWASVYGVVQSRTQLKQLSSSSSSSICVSEVIDISPGNLDSICASSSLAFRMQYSAYKLNKQGDNIQPWHNSFPICNQSFVPCLVLTLASSSAYRFLRRQVRWSGIPFSFRIFHMSISIISEVLLHCTTSRKWFVNARLFTDVSLYSRILPLCSHYILQFWKIILLVRIS